MLILSQLPLAKLPLSPNLPLLIKEKIGWYIWKNKIRACNQQYKEIVTPIENIVFLIYDYPKDAFLVKFHNLPLIYDQLIQTRNMNLMIAESCMIYNFTTYGKCTVALLPSKYVYSSGLSHKYGYKSRAINTLQIQKPPNRWVPDFFK